MSLKNFRYNVEGTVSIGEIVLENGATLPDVTLAFERVGREGAPVVLVCHALTGTHRTVGTSEEPGWWSGLIGEGKSIDLAKYEVITFNVLGGCAGSTGPTSQSPQGTPYRGNFPNVTVRDLVHTQKRALQKLGIETLHAVIGGSLGGMQAVEWATMYPTTVERLVLLASTPAFSAYGIAFNHLAKESILLDPAFRGGEYEGNENLRGISIARQLGMVTYRSGALFQERFQRHLQEEANDEGLPFYAVESYLEYQGNKLQKRFDANSYVRLLDTMNSHDIGRERGGWQEAATLITANVICVGYTQDLVYPPEEIQSFAEAVDHGTFHLVDTVFGHDGFLVEFERWGHFVSEALEKSVCKEENQHSG